MRALFTCIGRAGGRTLTAGLVLFAAGKRLAALFEIALKYQ
jgi:hypothetical protein